MEVVVLPDIDAASSAAADIFRKTIEESGSVTLGLATGSTPVLLYEKLVQLHRNQGLSFSRVTTFNLDEYVGINPEHEASYSYFMNKHLFSHVDIPNDNIHIPDGNARDIPRFCLRYEEQIKAAGGIDLQLLGIGTDGHIGFNEPSSSLVSRTRIKTLTPRTRMDNAIFFDNRMEKVPCHVITMGVGTIMDARRIVLMAFGEKKAEAVKALVEGPVTASVPASILQMHRNVTIILDEKAGAALERLDYYRWVYVNKPLWQC